MVVMSKHHVLEKICRSFWSIRERVQGKAGLGPSLDADWPDPPAAALVDGVQSVQTGVVCRGTWPQVRASNGLSNRMK